jgi:hypothetical protein
MSQKGGKHAYGVVVAMTGVRAKAAVRLRAGLRVTAQLRSRQSAFATARCRPFDDTWLPGAEDRS